MRKIRPKSSPSQIEELDSRILKLQHATRGDFPVLTRWHVELCRLSPLYYEWHKSSETESIHWMILTLCSLYLILIDGIILISSFS